MNLEKPAVKNAATEGRPESKSLDDEGKYKTQEDARSTARQFIRKTNLEFEQALNRNEKFGEERTPDAIVNRELSRFRESGDALGYVALSEAALTKRFLGPYTVDGVWNPPFAYTVRNLDPEMLQKTRQDVLTPDQNKILDESLMREGEKKAVEIAFYAAKTGQTEEEYLASHPHVLEQQSAKNALELRSRAIAQLPEEDQLKINAQLAGRVEALKFLDKFQDESHGKQYADGQAWWDDLRASTDMELDRLKSEHKATEYLALKGMSPIQGLDVAWNSFSDTAAGESPEELEQMRPFLTAQQNELIDAKLTSSS